jgi:hypothetical protein
MNSRERPRSSHFRIGHSSKRGVIYPFSSEFSRDCVTPFSLRQPFLIMYLSADALLQREQTNIPEVHFRTF